MFNTALYAINFGDFYYENLDCFINYSKIGLKEIVLIHVIDPSLFYKRNKGCDEKLKGLLHV